MLTDPTSTCSAAAATATRSRCSACTPTPTGAVVAHASSPARARRRRARRGDAAAARRTGAPPRRRLLRGRVPRRATAGDYRLQVQWADGNAGAARRSLPLPAGARRHGRVAARRRHAPAAVRDARRARRARCTASRAPASPSGRRTRRASASSATSIGWDGRRHPMRLRRECGVWEIFIPGVGAGARYKYEIAHARRHVLPLKADPYAVRSRVAPGHGQRRRRRCRRCAPPSADRQRANALDAPISIYEVHLGSWRRKPEDGNRFLNWDELADTLVPYAREHGLHPPRTAAGQRASVRRLLGLPADRPVRADRALRRAGRLSPLRRPLPRGRAWACCSTGCRRTSRPTRTAWRSFDGTRAVRVRRSARGLPPRLEHADLQLRPHRGAQLPGRQRAVLARALRRRRPARRCGGVDAVPRLQPRGRRMDAQRARRAREPRGDRLPASA